MEAFQAWHGPTGAAASNGKHAITDEAGKEGRRRALMSGSRSPEKGRERAHGHDAEQANAGHGVELGHAVSSRRACA